MEATSREIEQCKNINDVDECLRKLVVLENKMQDRGMKAARVAANSTNDLQELNKFTNMLVIFKEQIQQKKHMCQEKISEWKKHHDHVVLSQILNVMVRKSTCNPVFLTDCLPDVVQNVDFTNKKIVISNNTEDKSNTFNLTLPIRNQTWEGLIQIEGDVDHISDDNINTRSVKLLIPKNDEKHKGLSVGIDSVFLIKDSLKLSNIVRERVRSGVWKRQQKTRFKVTLKSKMVMNTLLPKV